MILKQIRDYTDLHYLATGGFSDVYVGRHKRLNREVAIKVVLPVHSNTPDVIQRSKIEAEIMARLKHPHIVPLYDYWYDSDCAYLVMPYIRGGNLADRLLQGPLEIGEAARLLEQIAGALSVAHHNRVVHQDIKSANILLDDNGDAYLSDFGIARDIERDVNLAQDSDNARHGSPVYIAPERILRQKSTRRSDIYSLGILMYQVLTGQTPFKERKTTRILRQHLETPLPRLQAAKLDLPCELNQPIQQATVKDPAMRYDDVLDFAYEFQEVATKLQYATVMPSYAI